MLLILNLYIAAVGLIFGSFFTVVGLRLANHESIIFPGSTCPSCRQKIPYYDLIPVVSYMFLLGRCRNCHDRISPVYPAVELATGILFWLALLQAANPDQCITALLLISLLIITTITDLKKRIVPNTINLFFFAVYSAYRLCFPLPLWWDSLLACLSILLFLSAAALLNRGGIGGGDIKLLAVIGILVGTQTLYIGLIIALFAGTLTCLVARMVHILKHGQPVPFVPFIALGMLVSFFFGEQLIDGYRILMNGFLMQIHLMIH